MSDHIGLFHSGSFTRDGCGSPTIDDIADIFPAGIMDGIDDELGIDTYELMKDFSNMSSSSADRYFPGDNEEEFLKPGPSKRPVQKEDIRLPAGVVKPGYPYAYLIYLALKNSPNNELTVSEIYNFITTNFPYYKYAQSGWKNSIRHNLSLSKSFSKNEHLNGKATARKTYLWAMVRGTEEKFENDLDKFNKNTVRQWLSCGDDYNAIREGTKGIPVIEPKIDVNENCQEMYKNLKNVIKQEGMDKNNSKKGGGSMREVAEKALGKLLNGKREIDFIAQRKSRSRKQSTGSNAKSKKTKTSVNEVQEQQISSNHGHQFDYMPLDSTNDPFPLSDFDELNGEIYGFSDFDFQDNTPSILYEDPIPTASSVSSSHETYSDIRSDSSWSDRNTNYFIDESESRELRKHCNFTLNGVPFKRKFTFNEDTNYLKKKKEDGLLNVQNTANCSRPLSYHRLTFYPKNQHENKENEYPM